MHLDTILSLIISALSFVASWNITAINNPGCPSSTCSESELTYIRASNQYESIHMLVHVSYNATPSVIAVHSRNPNAELRLNWTLLNSANIGQNCPISLDNVTESYGFFFLDLLELRRGQSVEDMFASNEQKNAQVHYFWKLNWKRESNSPASGAMPLMLTYTANGPQSLFSAGGQVQLKFWIEPDSPSPKNPHESAVKPLAIRFELSMSNLRLGKSSYTLGLQLALASNVTVINSEDYAFAVEQVDPDRRLGVVHLDSRVPAASHARSNSFIAVHEQPAAWFKADLTFRSSDETSSHHNGHQPARQHAIVMSEFREPLVRDKHKDALKHSLLYSYYGRRIYQNTKQFPTMVHVRAQWNKRAPPPIGLRIQNLAFGTPDEDLFNAPDTLTWRGRFEIGSISPSAQPLMNLQSPNGSISGHSMAYEITVSQLPSRMPTKIALIALIVIGTFVILLCAAVLLLYHCRYRLPVVVNYKRVRQSPRSHC